jgi:hypothetical protein
LKKKLKLGKIRFQAKSFKIGNISIFSGFEVVSATTPNDTYGAYNLSDVYNSLNLSFKEGWQKKLFQTLVFFSSTYLFYSLVVTVFLKIFFWDNLDFTPLAVKYPSVLTYSSFFNYFFRKPAPLTLVSKYSPPHFPLEITSVFILDV